MKFALRNLRATLTGATPAEREWLKNFLSYQDSRASFVRWKFGVKDAGIVQFFDASDDTIPSGYLSAVAKAAPEQGFAVEVDDLRAPPVAVDHSAPLAWLRDYQREAVDKVVRRTRGILWIPTGGGKTEIAAALTQRIPARWLFLVHRTNLLDNAAERYERRTGAKAGRIGEGVWNLGDGGFIVATFQTLWAALKKNDKRARALLESAQGLIVDEAHTLPASSFYKVVMWTPNAYWRVGLSGTPLARGDRRSMFTIAALGGVVFRLRPETLIDQGVLSKPTIRLVECRQAPTASPNWATVYRERVVRSTPRNKLLAEICGLAEKPALLFVQQIAHGRAMAKALAARGIRAQFAEGMHSVEHRTRLVKRLVDGEIEVLICTVIFQEGVDVPELRSVVVGTGGASGIAAIQRMGRGMRVAAGKTTFEVWDVADVGNRWLEKHSAARRKAYESEGHTVIPLATLPSP
jgi:hypothetical protein